MKYQSTRGGHADLSFQDVITSGYAPDDGMYMPMEIPKLSEETIESWASLSYIDIAKEIAKIYIEDEIPSEKIGELVDAGYSTFADPTNPIVTKNLSENMILLEMFHGKSLAFKDLSMACTAEFLRYFLEKTDSRATLLVATSGDTGSAALQAVSAVDRVDIAVVLPKDRISEVQERQMTTVVSDNCHVIRADGSSDEIDVPVRNVYADSDLVKKYNLGNLNSVNWCRMMFQMAHHFYAYFQGKKENTDKETIVFIPTGGLGNATAGSIAREMGLPLRMVCATTNNALYRAVYDNDYSVTDLVVSLAPAINIQVIYNFERILYLLSGMDTALVKQVQEDYLVKGAATPETVVQKLRTFMEVVMVTDDDIVATLRKCQAENEGYAVCPHTATALFAAYGYANVEDYNVVIYGAASPAKFSDVLQKAGVEWNGRNLLEELKEKETRYTDWEANEDWKGNLVALLESIGERVSS